MVSAIIVGKSNTNKQGNILFTAEVVKHFTPRGEDAVVFNSKQFILLKPPISGKFDLYIVQRGEISDFNNYFAIKPDRVKYYCDLLTSCSKKLYDEKSESQKTITYYVKNDFSKSLEKFTFAYDAASKDMNITAGDTSGTAISYSKSLEAKIEQQNGSSIVHFSIDSDQSDKYYLMATEYTVRHDFIKDIHIKTCLKNPGFLKIGGYSPSNIFKFLFTKVEEQNSPYFNGEMKRKFDIVSQLVKDSDASGNICESKKLNHFIIIDANSIVSNSSAGHHIPVPEKNIHILAPGSSDNFAFEMLVYHEGGSCPVDILTEEQVKGYAMLNKEQIQYLPKMIDEYIRETRDDLKHRNAQ